MSEELPEDIQTFLDNYPDNEDDPDMNANLDFYTRRGRSQPDGLSLHEYQKRWDGDYVRLERNHNFIQWLFPIQEQGVNSRSQPLQKHEIEAMKADKDIQDGVIASYGIMLDFYGMELADKETGQLIRADPDSEKWRDRYDNLLRNRHNFMRITRILKCLSELGLERLNAGFLLFVLKEQSENNQLNGVQSSMDRWWANCIRNVEEREWIATLIQRVRAGEVVFTEEKYEQALEWRKENGSFQGFEVHD